MFQRKCCKAFWWLLGVLPNASNDPLTPSPYNLLQGNPKFPSFAKVGKVEVLVERYLYFKKETSEIRPSVNPSIQGLVSIRYMVKYRRGQGGILKKYFFPVFLAFFHIRRHRCRAVESCRAAAVANCKNGRGQPACLPPILSSLTFILTTLVHCCTRLSVGMSWEWVQGGDPIYVAVFSLSSCHGHIWQNLVIFFCKKRIPHILPRQRKKIGVKISF